MPQNRVDDGVKEGTATSELKVLKLQRGRKAAQFTRACNAAETQITCRANEEELRKRLEALNTALDGVLKINDDYAEKVQEVSEIEESEEYATRMTARHASTVKAIEDAIKLKSSGCSASETEGKPMSLAPRRDGSKVVLGLLVAGCQCWKLPVVNQGRRAQYYTQQNDGSYSYGFDTAEGLYQAQEGDDVNEVRGKFGADGGSVEYTAGVNGYVVTSLKEPSAPSTRTYVSKTPVRYATLEELATHPEQVEDTAEVKAAKATFRATYDALAAAAEAAPDVNIITGPAPAAPVHSVTYSAPAPQQVYLAPAPVAIKYSGPAAPLDASGKVDDTAEVKAAKASFKAAYDAAAAAAAAAPDVNIITGAVPVATYSAPAPAPVAIKYQGPGAPLDASGNVDDTAEVKAAKATFRATYDALAAAAEAAPDVNIITGPAPAAPVHSVSYSAPAPHSAYLAPAPVTIKYSGPAAPLDASGNVDDTAEVKAAKATFKATYDALAAAAEAAPDVNIITGAVPAATYSAPAPAPVHSVTYSAPAPHSTYLAPAPVAIKYSGPAAPMDASGPAAPLDASGNVEDTAEVKAAKAAFRAAYDAAAAAAAAAPDDDIITSSGQVTSAGYSASSIPVVHSTYSASQGNMRTITFDGITLMVAEPYGSSKFGYSYE
ncbi:hypothetical protein FJT64_002691 [Amphibalanus amphitrite]|uniref:Uncharacterized protein n=1 Tax=Amphibalanus amphitrite TaxID=1232801 RepID=A0A6A4WBG6_AMPAM|nr:hypothetical protein FJT64_002691 [Amphibalanus amphitrite]